VLRAARATSRFGVQIEWVAPAAAPAFQRTFIHDCNDADIQLAVLERKLSRFAGRELEAELPLQPGSVLEHPERAAQRAFELEGLRPRALAAAR
jgi:hypothetical protein